MDTPLNHIFFPVSFAELFAIWNRFPAAVIYAGGTNMNLNQNLKEKIHIIIDNPENNVKKFPPVLLCLDKIDELHSITRTEHYLDIGAMVKLNSLLHLGKIVPHVICKCLENIAGIQVRNIATIGGNICSSSRLLDLSAPLAALDAQYELRNVQSSRWVSAARFHSTAETTRIAAHEILTRVRLPLHQWDYSVFKKFTGKSFFSDETVIFLAKTQKSVLSEIRIVYKAKEIVRNKDGETILNGKYLPLHRKNADEFIQNWKEFLLNRQNETDFFKNALLNNIEKNVYNLSE